MKQNTRTRTRRRNRKQTGGDPTKERVGLVVAMMSENTKNQVIHCVSQLKRFAPCIQEQPLRAYQFFYNLGRLQELLGETTHPEVWWKPIEKIVQEGRLAELVSHIDSLQTLIGLAYDTEVLSKGC
jgi:hypothetical protein